MTRISQVHGIPSDEFAGRGAMVEPSGFVPYLSLSKGEMRLWLAAQRAKLFAQWYGSDAPQYAQAYTMLENALNKGVHTGNVSFVGAIPDYLQDVARLIKRSEYQVAPAARIGYLARTGPGIGQIIPYQDRLQACLADANKIKSAVQRANAQAKCLKAATKERIVNDNLVNMAPHMLYKDIPQELEVPNEVSTSRKFHRLGVEGIAGVAEITDYELVYTWVENGVLQKNSQGGAGLIGSAQASFYLSPDYSTYWQKYQTFLNIQKSRPGINDPLVVTAIVTILTAAIGAAFAYLTEIRKTEILAMSEARGFGTPEYSAKKGDWPITANNPLVGGGLDMTTLLLLGAGAFLLLSDEK